MSLRTAISTICKRFNAGVMPRVLSLTSVATMVRMFTGLISVKVVAALIGPAGVALVGQLGNFANIVQTIAGGGITNGITKYVAENAGDTRALCGSLSAALRITLICSVVCGIVLVVFCRQLSWLVMLTDSYDYVIALFGLTVVLYALNAALLAAVNGFKEFYTFVKINIANSVVGVVFTVALVLLWGLPGALISAVTYQSVVFVLSLWMVRRRVWLRLCSLRGHVGGDMWHRYGGFALMSLVTALAVPLVQMLLRGYVMADISEAQAGIWEGMQKISNMYMMVATTTLSVYYLPRLSELTDQRALRREIFSVAAVVLPLMALGLAAIYLLRFYIIDFLFTDEFISMQGLFLWQAIADFMRLASWLVAFLMVAKAMTAHYVISELLSSASFLVLGYLFVSVTGIVGLVQAALINYILYFAAMLIIFRRLLFSKKLIK